MKSYSVAATLALLLTFVVSEPAQSEPAFVGAKACKKCHIKQYKSWAETSMATAFELLKPDARADAKTAAGLDPAKDYTTDESCLPCHVTGSGKPGGYGSGDDDEALTGVGCEMCHGAGGDFLGDDKHSAKNKEFKSADLAPLGFINKPQDAQCVNCHNEKSPFFKEFNFEERKDEGTHEHFPLKYEH